MRGWFIAVLLCAQAAAAQFVSPSIDIPPDTVATVGSRAVTARDFLERFELMPWMHKEQASRIEATKQAFLYSLIAEKLLALEAASQNIGNDSASRTMQYNLERMFVRDELYKREVLPKIAVSPREITEGLKRFAWNNLVEVLGVISNAEGELLYSKVKKSKNKERTLAFFKDSLYAPLDTPEVSFEIPDIAIQDAAYALGKDSLSHPFESPTYGLVMLRLLKRYPNPAYGRLSRPDQVRKVQQIISRVKEDSIAVKEFAMVTAKQRAEARPELFYRLADSVLAILRSDSNTYRTKNVFRLPPTAIAQIAVGFGAANADTFVTIDGGPPMTLREVLIGLSDNEVVFPNLRLNAIRWVLNNNIKTVIQNELLSREGMRKNLQQSENVRHDVATWMDNRRSLLLLRRVIDSVTVSDEEVDREYAKDPSRYGAAVIVTVQEILVDSVSTAKALRTRLDNGEDMASLARKYSKRNQWAANGGISPPTDTRSLGTLGTFAATAPIGVLQGPWKVAEGVTIYKVLERHIIDDSIRTKMTEIRATIRKDLLDAKRLRTMNRYIGTLAKQYGVTVNEAHLRSLKTTTTNMFTWRHLGFGGRMVAVPQVVPQAEWVDEWRRQELLNQ